MDMPVYFPKLGIRFQNLGRSFTLGTHEISYFGVLIAIGVLLAAYYIVIQARRSGQNPNKSLWGMIIAGGGALIGARGMYILLHQDLYKNPEVSWWNLKAGGLSFYGAILGGLLFAWVYCLARKLAFRKTLDIYCMGILLLQIVGRFGNFFNRECFGDYTNSIFAMQIPVSFVHTGAMTEKIQQNLVSVDGITFASVHPLFLYEAIWWIVLFFFLGSYRRKKKFDGELFAVWLCGVALFRILVEYLNAEKILLPKLNQPIFALISAVTALICVICILLGRSKAKKERLARRKQREAEYASQAGQEQSEQMEKEYIVITPEPLGTTDGDMSVDEKFKY